MRARARRGALVVAFTHIIEGFRGLGTTWKQSTRITIRGATPQQSADGQPTGYFRGGGAQSYFVAYEEAIKATLGKLLGI